MQKYNKIDIIESIMEGIKKNKNYILFFFLSIFLGLMLFYPYLSVHYSLDCYQDLLSNEQYYLASVAGRPLITLYFQVLNALNFNLIANQQFFSIFSIVIYSIGIVLILKKVSKELNILLAQDLFLPWIIIAGIVWNLFTTEVFQFNSSLLAQSLGLLCISIGILNWEENLNLKKFLLILIFLTLSLFFFQSLIAFFVVVIFIWILNFSKSFKKDLLRLAALYFIPLGINFIYIKFVHPLLWGATQGIDRTAGVDFVQNFLSLLRYQKFLWIDSAGLLPIFLFSGLVLSIFVLAIITRKNIKINLKKIFTQYVLIIILALFTGLLPHFLTKNIWISQRSTTIIGAIPSLLLLITFLNWKKLSNKFLIFLTIIIFLIFGFFINRIGQDLLTNNSLEQKEAQNIIQLIRKYESDNSIEVKKIFFSNDKNPMLEYPELISSMDINTRSLTRSWSFKSLMKFEGGIKYEYIQMAKDVREKLFKDQDYSSKDGNQVITDNSNVYVLIY